MLWLLTVVTTGVLLLIAGFVKEISKVPTAARPAALTKTAHAVRHAAASPASRRGSAAAAEAKVPEITDASSGLSYRLLSSPWRRGCPGVLHTAMFSWTAGEHAVAGQVDLGGTVFDWHGNACSGRLGPQFAYSGPNDLELAAIGVADGVGLAYYSGLQHDSTIDSSSSMLVSGHQAWIVTFLVTYPDAAGEGLAWTSEAGAVVLVDRGPGQAPTMFYVSVPDNLGTSEVAALVSSVQLSPG
jgi:hypothetical protein